VNEDTLQYYPTPLALAQRAWDKFHNRDIVRVLEPSAGTGELLAPKRKEWGDSYYAKPLAWDAIEVDVRHHARLRELGAKIVGFDFLNQQSCAIYSHIIMNPPFASGAKHVLHAWNTLYEGEIVAILNAETLRNPLSAERQHLARLVAEHGSVEFIADAFKGADVEREAEVEVALVHLTKRADSTDILGDLLEDLQRDAAHADELNFRMPNELALPTGFVEETVRNFEAAVQAAKEEAVACTRAAHYRARLGQTMEMLQMKELDADSRAATPAGEQVRGRYATAYEELKNAAWTQILRSTHVLSRLSSAAQKRVESQFESIKTLEFSTANVYGFLQGLVGSAGEIQMSMLCDVFDEITRYHSENTVFFMGWKSNDRHRTAGMRIKRTRFILPGEKLEGWRSSISFDVRQRLSDFDKVFAMLDGKRAPVAGLADLFHNPDTFAALRTGKRLTSDYFDVRYYPGIGTIHFFSRRQDIVERLNRAVGQHRQWLPPDMGQASADFRKQYEQAEKFDAEVREQFKRETFGTSQWRLRSLDSVSSQDEETAQKANEVLSRSLETVLEKHGIRPFEALEGQSAAAPLLLSAA
jgi:hypothetical protein